MEIILKINRGEKRGLRVRTTEEKGRGVYAARKFYKGQFVVEYDGERITKADYEKKKQTYDKNPKKYGSYVMEFRSGDKSICIDATKKSKKLGRLMNHNRKGNLSYKFIKLDDECHVYFVASRDIEKGEEFLWNYGDKDMDFY